MSQSAALNDGIKLQGYAYDYDEAAVTLVAGTWRIRLTNGFTSTQQFSTIPSDWQNQIAVQIGGRDKRYPATTTTTTAPPTTTSSTTQPPHVPEPPAPLPVFDKK